MRVGGGAYVLATPLRNGPTWTPELMLDAGASTGRGGVGLRVLGLPGLVRSGRGGDAILGWYEHDLGTLGDAVEVRGLAAIGPSWMPAEIGPRGKSEAVFAPAAQLELDVLLAVGAWELSAGASGFVAATEVPGGHAPLVGSGLVARAAWNGAR